MQIRENACFATIRISLNDVRIVTNMNTRHTFHVADPVPSDAIKI